MEGKREEESRRRGKCHRRAARLGCATEVTARRPADDNFRVRADQRVRRVAVLEALDEAGAALAPDTLAVVDVLCCDTTRARVSRRARYECGPCVQRKCAWR